MSEKNIPPASRSRSGCLTAALSVFGVLTAVAAVINLVAAGALARYYPDAPGWAPTGVRAVGALGLVSLAGFVLLWTWHRFGLYLVLLVGVVIFVLNWLIVGPVGSILGLVGLAIITALVVRQWRDFS